MNQPSRAYIDQQMALVHDFVPPLWRRLYERLQEEGFTEPQAMDLLKTYIMSSSGGAK